MDTPAFITHRGERVLVLDYSGAGVHDLPALLDQAERLVREQPPRSVRLLARLHGTEFSNDANKLLFDHLTANGPFAMASAVVGLDHRAGVIPIANRLSGRQIETFDDESAALDWLVSLQRPDPGPADSAVGFFEHEGHRILRIDFRRAASGDLMSRMNLAATMIRSQPERSVLTLTLVHGVSYDKETTAVLKEYVRANRPYVLAGAVVGLDYLRQIVLPLNRLTGRNLRAFDDEESAALWLTAESRRLRPS